MTNCFCMCCTPAHLSAIGWMPSVGWRIGSDIRLVDSVRRMSTLKWPGEMTTMIMMEGLYHYIIALCILGKGTGCRTAAMVTPLLLTSGSARCEAALHSCGTSPVCLYVITTVLQLCYGGGMMYEMKRRKPDPILLLTQEIFITS